MTFFLTSFPADLQIVELVVVCGTIVHKVKALCCQKIQLSMLLEQAARPSTQVTNNPLDRINCLAAFFHFCEAQFTHIYFLIDEITPVSTGLPRES